MKLCEYHDVSFLSIEWVLSQFFHSPLLPLSRGFLEKAMAPHSSTLAWKIPWMEEPGGLQSMGSLRVRHDWVTSFHFSLSCIGEGNGNPLHCSCLENPRDGGAWWAAVYGVAQSRTRLKQLSSSRGFFVPLNFLPLEWYHLQIWGCWYFSWQS